jgi:hypothetical protein
MRTSDTGLIIGQNYVGKARFWIKSRRIADAVVRLGLTQSDIGRIDQLPHFPGHWRKDLPNRGWLILFHWNVSYLHASAAEKQWIFAP